MPYTATIKFDLKVKEGPALNGGQDFSVESYVPFAKVVQGAPPGVPAGDVKFSLDVGPVDKCGDYEQLRFLFITASKFSSEACGTYVEYTTVAPGVMPRDWHKLEAPLFFTRATLRWLGLGGAPAPAPIWFKNNLGEKEPVTISILIGKSE